MTEEQWQTETRNAQPMVWSLRKTRFTRTKAGRRKLRLFACGCCRLIWDLLIDPASRQAVEVAERFAEGQASKKELEESHVTARNLKIIEGDLMANASGVQERTAASLAASVGESQAFWAAFYMTAYEVALAGYHIGERDGNQVLCDLLRCVIGNPFRLPALQRAWRTNTVTSLAQAAYQERSLPSGELDSSRLAILADALEECGCTESAILSHLRSPGPHIQGCWPVDLILKKS